MIPRQEVLERLLSNSDPLKLDKYLDEYNDLVMNQVVCTNCGDTRKDLNYGYCACEHSSI